MDLYTSRQLGLPDALSSLGLAGCDEACTVQVDEPALREGLPLKRARWESYLAWAVKAFRLSTVVAKPETQIVTHLCYSEFADILPVRSPHSSPLWSSLFCISV